MQAEVSIVGEERSFEGTAQDISLSGICLHAPESVPPGKTVNFRLKLILDGAHSDALELSGRVVWCTQLEGQYQLGAAFAKDLDSVTWTRLDVLLQFLSGELEFAADS